jgi:hypothetical protein
LDTNFKPNKTNLQNKKEEVLVQNQAIQLRINNKVVKTVAQKAVLELKAVVRKRPQSNYLISSYASRRMQKSKEGAWGGSGFNVTAQREKMRL